MQANQITLGVFAGGRATRLGGRDKAWIERDGMPQVLRLRHAFSASCGAVLISANRDLSRYAEHGLQALPDRRADIGPIGGLEVLAQACQTPWLFTVPVDSVALEADVLQALVAAHGQGAVARDAEGLQPLVALYRIETLRTAVTAAVMAGQFSVQALQARMALPQIALVGKCFGNLNTQADLQRAGCTDGAQAAR